MMPIDYLLIDPFNTFKSGVTQYVLLYKDFLLEKGKTVEVLRKAKEETLDCFCKRIALFVEEHVVIEIEAPETLACTRYVSHDNIHIRLHLSRQVGKYLQGFNVHSDLVLLEQNEINKARYISAPSEIALAVSREIFDIEACRIYPNPIDMQWVNKNYLDNIVELKKSKEYDSKLYFIARGENLKGLIFLELFKYFEDKLICIGDERLKQFLLSNNLSIPFILNEERIHLSILKPEDVVIIPSLFETWSMIGVEVLSKFSRIVTWDHLGFCEFFDNDLLVKVEFPNLDLFIKTIETVLATPIGTIENSIVLENFKEVNTKFVNGVENQVCCRNKFEVDNPSCLINEIRNIAKRKKTKKFKALLKKLVRNPLLFWQDSKLLRICMFLKK